MRDLCETQIEKTPEWLTPYLCSGVAHANLGQRAEAMRRLEHVEEAAAGNPLYLASPAEFWSRCAEKRLLRRASRRKRTSVVPTNSAETWDQGLKPLRRVSECRG